MPSCWCHTCSKRKRNNSITIVCTYGQRMCLRNRRGNCEFSVSATACNAIYLPTVDRANKEHKCTYTNLDLIFDSIRFQIARMIKLSCFIPTLVKTWNLIKTIIHFVLSRDENSYDMRVIHSNALSFEKPIHYFAVIICGIRHSSICDIAAWFRVLIKESNPKWDVLYKDWKNPLLVSNGFLLMCTDHLLLGRQVMAPYLEFAS